MPRTIETPNSPKIPWSEKSDFLSTIMPDTVINAKKQKQPETPIHAASLMICRIETGATE